MKIFKLLACLFFGLSAMAQLPVAIRTTNGTSVNLTEQNTFTAGNITTGGFSATGASATINGTLGVGGTIAVAGASHLVLQSSTSDDLTAPATTVSGTLEIAGATIASNNVTVTDGGQFIGNGAGLTNLTATNASSSVFGVVKVDGTTVVATNGVISSVGGGSSSTTNFGNILVTNTATIGGGITAGGASAFSNSITLNAGEFLPNNASNVLVALIAGAGGVNMQSNLPAGTNNNLLISDNAKSGGAKWVDPVNLTPAFVGSSITALNAGNISSGTLTDARLSTNVPVLNASSQTWNATGQNNFANVSVNPTLTNYAGMPFALLTNAVLTAQTASVSTINFYTNSVAGFYQCSGIIGCSTAGSAGTVTVTASVTQLGGGVVSSTSGAMVLTANTAFTSAGPTVYVPANSVFSVSTTVTGAVGSPQYYLGYEAVRR